MSSSTSNSREWRFLMWVAAYLIAAMIVSSMDIWTGVVNTYRRNLAVVDLYGEEADYLILGDSKTGPFNFDGLAPFLDKKGLVFNADSVTPCYHLFNFRKVREQTPEFKPKLVFICIGANNFNKHGLHCRRDTGFFDLLPLSDAAELSLPEKEYMAFAEAFLSRIFPVYRHRVQITHFNFSLNPEAAINISPEKVYWEKYTAPDYEMEIRERDPIADRNYHDIYRRSVYNKFEYSRVTEAALAKLVEEIKSYGGEPMIVLLPVTEEMMVLENDMVGDKFISEMQAFADARQIRLLDYRDQHQYHFQDINHLSKKGAKDFAFERLQPIIDERLQTGEK